MSQNIHQARRREADRQARQVQEICRDFDRETERVIRNAPRLLDKQRLRGIPVQGATSGIVVGEVVPGSDEHLDQLSEDVA